jgi:ribosomal protein S18 acetylase RimI-like enzyme
VRPAPGRGGTLGAMEPTTPHLHVRSVTAADRDALASLFARMSAGSRYLRFHAPMPVVAEAELDRISGADGRSRVALAAVDPRDGSFAGIAEYAPTGDGSSDVAFAVADDWQGRGVGTMLALALLGHASRNRRARLVALTLSENRAARALLRRVGFRTTWLGRGQVELALDLPMPVAVAA